MRCVPGQLAEICDRMLAIANSVLIQITNTDRKLTDVTKTPKTRHRTPGRPRALQADEIIGVALQVLNEGGRPALSIREIARRLQTGPATLYNYFGSLPELEDAVVNHLLGSVAPPVATEPQQVRHQLVEMVVAYYRVVLTYPDLEIIAGSASEQTALAILNQTLRALVSAGADVETAGLAYALLRGFAYNQALTRRRAEARGSRSARNRYLETLAYSDKDIVLAYLQSSIYEGEPEQAFRRGVERSIDRLLPELRTKI